MCNLLNSIAKIYYNDKVFTFEKRLDGSEEIKRKTKRR
jgi:hypothetical protein